MNETSGNPLIVVPNRQSTTFQLVANRFAEEFPEKIGALATGNVAGPSVAPLPEESAVPHTS